MSRTRISTLLAPQVFDRLLAAGNRVDAVAQLLKHHGGDFPLFRDIIDDQHALRAEAILQRERIYGIRGAFSRGRKIEIEGRSPAFLALNIDESPVIFYG